MEYVKRQKAKMSTIPMTTRITGTAAAATARQAIDYMRQTANPPMLK